MIGKQLTKKKQRLYVIIFLGISFLLSSLYLGLYFHLNHAKTPEPSAKITAILNSEDNLFWKEPWLEIKDGAEDRNYSLSEYHLSFSESADSYLEIALRSGTDGIIFNPNSSFTEYTEELLQQAYDQGICLIALDAECVNVPSLYIGIDNVAASQEISDYISEHIQEEDILLLSNYVNSSLALQTRLETFRTGLIEKGYGDRMSILSFPESEAEKMEYLYSILSERTKPAIIVAIGPRQTLIAARVLTQLEDSSLFRLIGFGETQEALDFQEDGTIEALLVQDNKEMGRLAIEYMDKMLSGEQLSGTSISSGYSLLTAGGQ